MYRPNRREIIEQSVSKSLWQEFGPTIKSFHIKQKQADDLYWQFFGLKENDRVEMDGREYAGGAVEKIDQVVFPFDAFEVIVDDPREVRATPNHDAQGRSTYKLTKFLFCVGIPDIKNATYRRQIGLGRGDSGAMPSMIFTILDQTAWDYGDNEHSGAIIGWTPETGDLAITEILSVPYDHPGAAFMVEAYHNRTQVAKDADTRHWFELLYTARAFADMLQHRGVATPRIENPARPENRQQRRAMERDGSYVEGEHYSIVLRPKLTVVRAFKEASAGKSLKAGSPKRRHLVSPHLRKYTKGRDEPLVVEIAQHVRGGTGRNKAATYDATKLKPQGDV